MNLCKQHWCISACASVHFNQTIKVYCSLSREYYTENSSQSWVIPGFGVAILYLYRISANTFPQEASKQSLKVLYKNVDCFKAVILVMVHNI